jgi:hypothetical protein
MQQEMFFLSVLPDAYAAGNVLLSVLPDSYAAGNVPSFCPS